MSLGPDLFKHSRFLSSKVLSGVGVSSAELNFSPDEKYLIAHSDDGSIQAWETSSGKRILHYVAHHIRGACFSSYLNGVVGAVQDKLLLFKLEDESQTPSLIVTDLPLPDHADCLNPNDPITIEDCVGKLLLASNKWVASIDLTDANSRAVTRVPLPDDCNVRHAAPIVNSQSSCFSFITSRRINERTRICYTKLDEHGIISNHVEVDADGFRLIQASNIPASLGMLPIADDTTLVFINQEQSDLLVRALSPFTRKSVVYLSRTGCTFAFAAPDALNVWRLGHRIQHFQCDNHWYSPRLSECGKVAVVSYRNDDGDGSDFSGVIDLHSGEPIGYCNGHLNGSPPHAFSKSNKYFASMVTDIDSCIHPEHLSSGSIILTELFK